ncbi:uncharacterized protein LY89DRAFT_629681 [Mollisia scopiformis]|uniref:Glycoprotease family protein n=1 Tax=Mollisia scopiformis TaxID=149040 RepID=A0A132B959_MOLSC|nr:uncharacterized protein LY89DRAFT_629681 [Mollisia scopiformis]KUJ08529.1 hypothetical protein LY89DRAFT_629681 [Mollisia scopiformis]
MPPVQLQPSQTMPQMGRFVDMAALRALNGESNQSSGGFWRTKKTKALTRAPNTMPTITKDSAGPATTLSPNKAFRMRNSLLQSPVRPGEDLSPGDRPIVIGISIPSSDISVHSVSPQTAVSETTKFVHSYERRPPMNHTPDTPTIIITPAQEVSAWSPLGMQATSLDHELYDSNSKHYTANDAPPVPQMPTSFLEDERQRIAAQRSYFSPDSDDVTTWGDDDETHAPPRSRVASTYTVFEEDESPVMARKGRAVSVTNGTRAHRHASISTIATQRRSKGWWNYITTPFLTRSNTFATRELENQEAPALPDLAIAVAKAQTAERDAKKWEKQFSPTTPATSTTIASEQWWDLDAKKSEQSPVVRDIRHKVQTSTGTLPIVLSETAGFGAVTSSSISSLASNQLSRENTSSSFGCAGETESPEREVPILADAPRTRSLRSNNPYVQPTFSDLSDASQRSQPDVGRAAELPRTGPAPALSQAFYSPSVGGPPPYSPSPNRVKYRAILPPEHAAGTQYPLSPGPVSPGLQQAMSSGGAIPMSEVPLSPPARRPINLNSGYAVRSAGQLEVPVSGEHYGLPPTKASKKAEAKRRRHEKEDVVAHRAGGFWRGRGCVPARGCYGRNGAEGRKRRRWYLFLIIFFLTLIILIIVFATTLHRKSNTVTQPSQWLNLTGFPPIFLGLSTVVAPVNIETNTGCVFPATQWSCDLPKDLQSSVAPNQPNQPDFFLYVQWDNSSATNATFANVTGNKNLITRAGNPVSAGQFMKHLLLKARDIVTFSPNPAPPTFAEEFFLGNTTDDIVSSSKAGEPTPFYISFLPSLNASIPDFNESLDERDTDPFPNVTQSIPAPSLNSDGTAAPANLLPSPLPLQQPIRLYDRGLPTEHYGFYSYFDRSIFLKSLALLNETNSQDGEVPDDLNGGATEAEANFRCTWSETRFLVQMWTRMGSSAKLNNATSSSSSPTTELLQPGSFPYPITITTDRHGGDPATKMIYCYEMNDRQGIVAGSAKLSGENRAFGGVAVNPAPTVFFNASTTTLGGFDGGTGGCACAWTNFGKVVNA